TYQYTLSVQPGHKLCRNRSQAPCRKGRLQGHTSVRFPRKIPFSPGSPSLPGPCSSRNCCCRLLTNSCFIAPPVLCLHYNFSIEYSTHLMRSFRSFSARHSEIQCNDSD